MATKRATKRPDAPLPLRFNEMYDLFLGGNDRWMYRLLVLATSFSGDGAHQYKRRVSDNGDGWKSEHSLDISISYNDPPNTLPTMQDLEVFDWFVRLIKASGLYSATFDLRDVAGDLGRSDDPESIKAIRASFHKFFRLNASIMSEVRTQGVTAPSLCGEMFGFVASIQDNPDHPSMFATMNSAVLGIMDDWPESQPSTFIEDATRFRDSVTSALRSATVPSGSDAVTLVRSGAKHPA